MCFVSKIYCVNLGSAPTTYIGSRVGSDFPKTLILNVGSGRVGDLVGRLVGIFKVNLAKKDHRNEKIKPENAKIVLGSVKSFKQK